MLKKALIVGSMFTVLSLVLVSPAGAQEIAVGKCGFWAKLFGKCTPYDQTAAAVNARIGSTTKEGRPLNMKVSSSTKPLSAEQIQCVGVAIATREASLASGIGTFNQSISSAYTTRAAELAVAYSKTNVAELRASISVAWKNFNTTTKEAQKSWRTTKDSAWKTFKTNAKACGTSNESLSDSANSVTEMSGQ